MHNVSFKTRRKVLVSCSFVVCIAITLRERKRDDISKNFLEDLVKNVSKTAKPKRKN